MYVNRDLERDVKRGMAAKEIVAVIGSRQSGKTTMLNKILGEIEKKGKKIDRVSFDDSRELELFKNEIDSFAELHIKNSDILFIDEVQYAEESGKKLKYLYDKFGKKIVVSGSSATELSVRSIKYLVGRVFIYTLYPFSFAEFLRAKDMQLSKIYEEGKYGKQLLKMINRHLEEFLLYGGYPRVVLAKTTKDKEDVLKNIYNTYLLKEIREILGLASDYRFTSLIKALSLQTSNIINYNELSSISGFTYKELKNQLNILEKTFVCKLIRPFHTNKRLEIVKSPKIYFHDNGFRNTCINNFTKERSDRGALLENFVFTEITKNDLEPQYWHTKSNAEIDFIIEKNGKILPIEVKSGNTEKATKSVYSFAEKYAPKKIYLLSPETEKEKKIGKQKIIFAPVIKASQITKN